MTHLNETLYSCGIACSCEGCRTKAGNYQIDLLLANVCKQNITRYPYEIVRLAEDLSLIHICLCVQSILRVCVLQQFLT